MEHGAELERVRDYLAADHDGLMSGAATLVRLAGDRRFAEAALLVRGLRARFALHVAGTIETLESLPIDARPQLRTLRAEQRRLDSRFDALDGYAARHDGAGMAAAARRLADFIDEHAARELGPLRSSA